MAFYFYLFSALTLCLILLVFNITFGLPIIIGIPFAVSKQSRVRRIVELAKELSGEPASRQALDLGSGDGRYVVALAQAGWQAQGVEINPFLVWLTKWKIWRAKLKAKAFVQRANFWQTDLSSYDVIVLFGVFYVMARLEKKMLAELKPGTIVICNHYQFPNWPALKQEKDIFIYKR